MSSRTTLLILCAMAATACSSRHPTDETATSAKTAQATSTTATDASGAGAKTPAAHTVESLLDSTEPRRFHVRDNGVRCITHPCPSWTAQVEDATFPITGINLSALKLSKDKEVEVSRQMAQGQWHVMGHLMRGPKGPAGTGTTLKVLQLAERAGGGAK
jgi:hypothetical protein